MIEINIHTLRALCKGDPSKLPLIVIHKSWLSGPMPDSKGRVHVGPDTAALLIKEVPLEEVERWPDAIVARIAITKENLEAGGAKILPYSLERVGKYKNDKQA